MEQVITEWIDRVVADGSWEQYNNLRLDVVYGEGAATEILQGIKALNLAADYLVARYPGYRVALGFSLRSLEWPVGINFSDVRELNGQMDHSPGSLYLYQDKSPDWQEVFDRCSRFLLSDLYIDLLYAEYKPEDVANYRRVVWVKAVM